MLSTRVLQGSVCLTMTLFAAEAIPGQTIRGTVVSRSGESVAQALVRVHSTSESAPLEAVVDSSGAFAVRLKGAGRVHFTVEALGYQLAPSDTLSVGRDDVVSVRLMLEVAPVPVQTLEVVSTHRQDYRSDALQGFQERMEYGLRIGAGHFITREDARLTGAARISHVLGSAPGIRTYPHPEIPGAVLIGIRAATPQVRLMQRPPDPNNEKEMLAASTGGCATIVYVDGVQIRDTFSNPLDNYLMPAEVHGIEIYRRPSELPPEFSGSDSRCGVIAIWTRRHY